MNLQIIPSAQIDNAKWDACVSASSNGLIYADSKYLSAMADNWDGLVVDDYTTVMPLPWRRKWGIKYLYTPPFVQQLGLIGEGAIDIEKEIKGFIQYGDYLLNHANSDLGIEGSSCANYILPLSSSHETIIQQYSNELSGYIKRATAAGLTYEDGNVLEAIELYQKYYQERMPHVKHHDFDNFKRLCTDLEKEGKAFAKRVYSKDKEGLATAFFLKDSKRIYNLMPTTTPLGRKQYAMHFLMDNLFKEYAETTLLFDFEGSDLAGVKKFYEQFGSINQPYLHWHFNQLPWWLRLIKK